MLRRVVLCTIALCWVTPPVASAQDIEFFGRHYGTRPPQAYFDAVRADRGLFRLSRGFASRPAPRDAESENVLAGLGPRGGPLLGDLELPLILGLPADAAASAFSPSDIDDALWDDRSGTVRHYYDEVSGGAFRLTGESTDWVRSTLSALQVTGGASAIDPATTRIGAFIHEVLNGQSARDWGRFDNDGPDGLPNSGDDDGYVDAVVLVHPERGAECGSRGEVTGEPATGNRIWSHFWNLSDEGEGAFDTGQPAAAGGTLKIDDYIVVGSKGCYRPGEIMEIGVTAHELGHVFGLPDLYDTCDDDFLCPGDHARTSGVGLWGLMGYGVWGCDGSSPWSPCHLSAWSKASLGWVDVLHLAQDTDHGTLSLPPVESSGRVFRIDAGDGSGEYLLLEYRTRAGYDAALVEEGLLAWQIDPDWIADRWASNRVNANAHLGVRLRQADGRRDLDRGSGRGDAGDPFPGSFTQSAFHAGTDPASDSYDGRAMGVTLLDIAAHPDGATLTVVNGYRTVVVQTQGATNPAGLLTVDDVVVSGSDTTFLSAPFERHPLAAAAGDPVSPGERIGFAGWSDDLSAPRVRSFATPLVDAALTARYEGVQYELALTLVGGINGVAPGRLTSEPASEDLWFRANTPVELTAAPQRGFSFSGWEGLLAGQGNPASFELTAPDSASAVFQLVYAVPSDTLVFAAASQLDLTLEVSNGTPPFFWSRTSGVPPQGVRVESGGRVTGSALFTGTYEATYQITDSLGLQASATITFESQEPVFTLQQLLSPFLLSGPPLTEAQREFLDLEGNGIPPYDLGDFRAWLLAHPELPMSGGAGSGGARDDAPPGAALSGGPSGRGRGR